MKVIIQYDSEGQKEEILKAIAVLIPNAEIRQDMDKVEEEFRKHVQGLAVEVFMSAKTTAAKQDAQRLFAKG